MTNDDLSSKRVLFWDTGLFLPLALRLAESFGEVQYHTAWQRGFPRIGECIIGDGHEKLVRCDDPFDQINHADLIVFPDLYPADLQAYLDSTRRRVWGARNGAELEMNRRKFLRILHEVGLRVPEFKSITGTTKLSEYLRDKTDLWIKVSKFRGSFETAHWRSWEEDNCTIDSWAVEFGPCKELVRFLVFEPIGDELEIGGDTFCIDGKWPGLMLRGDEYKDKCYIGAVTKQRDMPDPIKEVLEAFGPVLAADRYRQNWSMELRGEGDKWFFIDATCRFGLPSTASQIALWKNLPEIIWAGAHGDLVEPEPVDMFSVECALCMKGERGAWRKTIVPEPLRDVMKLGNCCMINGAACFPPDDCHDEEIGWLVSTGDSIKAAIHKMLSYAKGLPDGVSAKTDALANLLKEIHQSEAEGIPFTEDVVPEPEVVLQDA